MNCTIESGGMKELEFGGASPCISGRGIGVTTLKTEFWTNCNLFNSKSVSDRNRELQ